jgi:DNA-binding beta-propeller fold protein YncE/tetratricopeptide (TPR) repeat protein
MMFAKCACIFFIGCRRAPKPGFLAEVVSVTGMLFAFIFLSLLVPSRVLSYSVVFQNEFGSHGRGDSNLREPRAMAIDDYGDIYIADTENNRIQVFSPQGAFLRKWGKKGDRAGEFDAPAGIAVRMGKVFVSDTDNDRVQIFDKQGNYIDSFGRRGDDPKEFKEPRGIAAWNGMLYVADTDNDRVQVFSEDGIFLYEINAEKSRYARLKEPYAVSVDLQGNIYIIDNKIRLSVIDPKGTISGTTMMVGASALSAEAIYVTSGGIYTARKNRVYKYDFAFKNIYAFGSEGESPGAFRNISALAADDTGSLFVLDAGKNSVQKFLTETLVSGAGPSANIPSTVSYVKDVSLPPGRFLAGEEGRLFIFDDGTQTLGAWSEDDRRTSDHYDLSGKAGGQDGHIWTVDKERHCLREFDAGGKLLRTIGQKGEGDGEFYYPSALVAHSGDLYVADTGNARIQVLDGSGKFIRSFAGAGKGKGGLDSPVGLAFDQKNNLYIADDELNKVVKTDQAGNFISEFGVEGSGPGRLDNPRGLLVIGEEVYVLDSENNRVEVFDTNGEYLRKFGSKGNGKGEFKEPAAMFIDRDYNLFVFDKRNDRVQVLRLLLTPSSPKVLRADGMLKEIKVTWLPCPEPYVDFYTIYRRREGERDFEEIGKIDSFSSFSTYGFFDKNLKSDTVFSYAVAAVSQTGNISARGNVVSARTKKLVPSAPRLNKVETGQRDLVIQWIPSPEPYTDHYVVMRNNEAWHTYMEIAMTDESSFQDSKLTPNTLYKYRVVAVGEEGDRSEPLDIETRTMKLPPIEIVDIALDDLFANNYKYYETNPVGSLVLKNNSETAITKIKISLMVSGYMDYPTESIIENLDGGIKREVPLHAVFNNRILDLAETATLQSEISIFYQDGEKNKTVSVSKPLTVFEKHALMWDNIEKASIFITPKDPMLLELAAKSVSKNAGSRINKSLLQAKAVFEELGALGITYIQDPNNPYQIVSKDVSLIDYIQYPRETLQRKAGDCDDLVVLYSSLLESLGIDTAFVAYPGHILLMFDTSLGDEEVEEFGFPPEEYTVHRGTIWIPVEVTLVGTSFSAAWKRGIDQLREMQNSEMQIVVVEDAWKNFKPAMPDYRESPLDLEGQERTGNDPPGDTEELRKQRVEYISSLFLNAPDTPYTLAQLGILYGENAMYEEAMDMFKMYEKKFGQDATVMNNIGNLYLLQGKYADAEKAYLKALLHDLEDPGIMVNFARCYYKQGDKEKARRYLEKAARIDPDIVKKYFYLASELRH